MRQACPPLLVSHSWLCVSSPSSPPSVFDDSYWFHPVLNVRGRVWKHDRWTWKICLPSFNETLPRQWGHIKRNALGCLHSFRLKQTLAQLMGVHRHFKRRTLWRRLEVHIMESSLFLRTTFPHKSTHLLHSPSCPTNKSNLWPSCCAGHASASIHSQYWNEAQSPREALERLGIARNGQILSLQFRQCTLISPCHSGLAISAAGGLTPPDNSKHCVSSSLADCTGNIHQLRCDIWRMHSVRGRCDVPLASTPISCYTFTVSSPSFCQGWKESVAKETR